MQDFNTSRFIYHAKEYLKATTRQAIYSASDVGVKVVGYLFMMLLVVSLLFLALLLLLLAGVHGVNAWLEVGLGWSFLIVAVILLLVLGIVLLLRQSIVRRVCTISYRKMHDTLAKWDNDLRPQQTYSTTMQEMPNHSSDETMTQNR